MVNTTGSVDPCADDPCINGTCADDGGAATCTCDLGWAGDICDECDVGYVADGGQCIAVTSCATDPCGAGASCADLPLGVECTRVFAFTGADQPWDVPPGVISLDVSAVAASGGCALGGLGGEAIATICPHGSTITSVRSLSSVAV